MNATLVERSDRAQRDRPLRSLYRRVTWCRVEIARTRAAEQWAFVEPVEVVQRRARSGAVKRYEIATNQGKLRAKARFVIDAAMGTILSEGYVPR